MKNRAKTDFIRKHKSFLISLVDKGAASVVIMKKLNAKKDRSPGVTITRQNIVDFRIKYNANKGTGFNRVLTSAWTMEGMAASF